MKVCLTIIMLCISSASFSGECRKFTEEQHKVLKLASSVGKPYNLSQTLMAIVVQESFVGDYIIKVNSKDGKYGSYGITHINLETAMWLHGEGNSWKARAELAPKLVTDDVFAMNTSILKLETKARLGWEGMVRSYNGSISSPKTAEYLSKIKGHMNNFKRCGGY